MKAVDVSLTYPLKSAIELLENSSLSLFVWDKPTRPGPSELADMANCSSAMLSLLTDKIDSNVLGEGSKIRVIANNAVGFNNIDLDLCRKLKISVYNTPDVLTDATADLALGLMMDRARNISSASTSLRAGKWRGWDPTSYVGVSLRGKKLGIIGMGRIGQAMARRAHDGLGMEIFYTARATKNLSFKTQKLELDELLKSCDFISIHCALTHETKALLSTREFALMKSSAILINTSRGEVIDEKALVIALKTGEIAGAALDVYEQEPLSLASDLPTLPNVTLTPHIGSADWETREAMALLSARNIIDALAGERPKGCVLFADDL